MQHLVIAGRLVELASSPQLGRMDGGTLPASPQADAPGRPDLGTMQIAPPAVLDAPAA